MHQVASDLNKAKREPFFYIVVPGWDQRVCRTGDSLQKDIFGWLSPPDPWKNHHAACKLRHCGTAEWFIHGNTFPEWKMSDIPGSLLWVHGKRMSVPSFCGSTDTKCFLGFVAGAGKSVFWYVKSLYVHLGNLSCPSAPKSSKTSMLCGKLVSRR